MVYRGISARCYQPARRPSRPPSNGPLRPCRSHYDGRALSLLILPPLPPVSFRLHYLRTPYVMPVKQPALTLSKLMRLVSPLVVGAVGWLAGRARGYPKGAKPNRETKRVGYQKGNIFDCSDGLPHTHRPPPPRSPCI